MAEFSPMPYYHLMRKDGVILSYNGTISQSILTDLGLSLRNQQGATTGGVVGKLLFSTFIELAQNVLLHSEERTYSVTDARELGNGIVIVKETPHAFVVISGNVAKKEIAAQLEGRVNHINSLNEEQLREFYREERKKPAKDQNSGNVGLIDLARKSGNPLRVTVEKLDQEYVFLSIYVTLSK